MDVKTEKTLTIDEVAKLCGVSKTTISRFLNGKYENISADTRERIRQKIEELDYHPNRTAQRLKASHSMLIGCVIGDVSSPFSGLLLRGVDRICEAAGYQVLFADSRDDPQRERQALQGFLENRVDGLIVNSSGGNDELLLSIRDKGVPVVLADRGLLGEYKLDTVSIDDRNSAYQSVKFLLECGYKHVAFFTLGNKMITPRILRYKGYTDAVRDLCPDEEPIVYQFDKNNNETCRECIRNFRCRFSGERIAILAVNGVTAQNILLAMNAEGVIPGWDYGLCTYDDWTWLQLAPPGITSLALSSERIGEESAKMLLERISGKRDFEAPPQFLQIPAELKVRGSTPK